MVFAVLIDEERNEYPLGPELEAVSETYKHLLEAICDNGNNDKIVLPLSGRVIEPALTVLRQDPTLCNPDSLYKQPLVVIREIAWLADFLAVEPAMTVLARHLEEVILVTVVTGFYCPDLLKHARAGFTNSEARLAMFHEFEALYRDSHPQDSVVPV